MMEQHLFILLLFTAIVPLVLSVPRKYYLIQQGATWSAAQAYCRATHIDLAVITSYRDLVQLQNEAQRHHFSTSAWIGLYNYYYTWLWSYGSEPLGSVTLWNSGEPNNYGGIEACGAVTPTGWNDLPCDYAYPYICFDGNKTGNSRYIYISNPLTWAAAQAFCRLHYTDLVIITSATEISVIGGMVSGDTWVGLYRDTWRWTDHTIFSTTSWLATQPDQYQWKQGCGFISNGQAADTQCSNIRPFFCYTFITGKQQIVRMKIRSYQDVNDPSVKAAILEQIKQKMNNNGMGENITVKWREESDGKVFNLVKEEL
ncbi:putative C-type lectin domain family 20 member A [Tachysurus fulvidraco]|uniref:putative C-type lectin domain family 20 member A n=1 Tax=Tachysurus fulvidraco TaxID=1234273 RepID=UPI000F4E697A|nr:putative C-type lectin domain family 20 member A [Tachysurus fulvidraco]